jgi:outer membrane protein TolC
VAKLSKEKETQNYEAQQDRYAAGQVSTHDMLDYQDKLAQAELDYINALVEYNIALIDLDKSQGLTLAKNDIKLEE